MSKQIDADLLRKLMQKDEKELLDGIDIPIMRELVKNIFDAVRYEILYIETHTEDTK